MGTFSINNKVVLELDGKKAWFFHGDVFDISIKHTKWLAKLGAIGYDFLILINRAVNNISHFFGKEKVSLSKKIKNSVKSAIKFINNFEETVTTIAIDNQFDYVVCGHIHQPIIKEVVNNKGSVMYLNSGDWVENLTALEYNNKQWSIYKYEDFHYQKEEMEDNLVVVDSIDQTAKELFGQLMADFNFKF
jgi:UDP-2,3-diacylglucosamine pyrophosphatase LpxH